MEKDAAALLLLAGVIVVAMLGIAMLVSGSRRRAELAALGGGEQEETLLRGLINWLDARLRRTPSGQRLDAWLQGAGVDTTGAEFVVICAAAGVLAYMGASLFLSPGVALLVALAVVIAGARFYVERERRERRDAFIAQLPDLARMLSNGTAAGLSMAGAVELASREMPEPAAGEMRSVVQELRLGRPLDEALERLRRRLPSREVSVLMTTLIIQQRAGGDTVRALQELSATLEARKDLLREVKTILSGSVSTSYIVAFIGAATIVLANAMSPGVLREMTTTLPGILALTITGVLWGVAFVLIHRLTKVDV